MSSQPTPQQKAIEIVTRVLEAFKLGDPQYHVYDFDKTGITTQGPHNINLVLTKLVDLYTTKAKNAVNTVKQALETNLNNEFYDIEWSTSPNLKHTNATLIPSKSPISTSTTSPIQPTPPQSQPPSPTLQPIASASSSTSLTAPFAQLNLSQAAMASQPQAGPSAPQYAPSVAPTQALSIVSQLSMSSQDVRRALGKIKTGLDADISESEFRDILKKNPSILRLAKRSAEEGLTGVRSLSELRNAMQELTTLNEIQHSSYYTVDGEKPLRIKESRPVPTQFQIVSGNRSRKPVGL
jgi:hypothetical protein